MRLVMKEPVERMDRPYARRWWALIVLCLSLLIIVMANTALTVAAPDMTKDLGLTSADLQWVIDGYTVPYAALMLLLGAIGDKYSFYAGRSSSASSSSAAAPSRARSSTAPPASSRPAR